MGYWAEGVITWAVRRDDVIYWMHYADHAELDVRERQAVRHLRDSMLHLVKTRDHVQTVREAMSVNAITGRWQSTPLERRTFFDATCNFFQTFYATLSAWSSLLVRLASRLKLRLPPTASMASFLRWIAGGSGFRPLESSRVSVMDTAREFRAILDHPGQVQPYEWDVYDDGVYAQNIRLYGPARGAPPTGATANSGPLAASGGWSFIAPGLFDTCNAVADLMGHFMPMIAGQLPRVDESGVSCPDQEWESTWNGDRRVYSEPTSLYVPDGSHVDPSTGGEVADPAATKRLSRCTVPPPRVPLA